MKMHDREAEIDAALVRRLVAAQFPELAGLPVREFSSTDTATQPAGRRRAPARGHRLRQRRRRRPATDVIPAWAVFGRSGRQAFRAALVVDDATWIRARGIALHQAEDQRGLSRSAAGARETGMQPLAWAGASV
jgi:aminoglycoside phosphotransferase (APT) family kinase protein